MNPSDSLVWVSVAARVPVGVAQRYEPAGYHPASYEIRWDEASAEYRVALTDLAWRE